MSQAIVDPGELRRFAQALRQFNQEMQERVTALSGRLDALGATWRDQENEKFAEDFRQHLQGIVRTIETTDEYIPFLLRKAERIEEYLDQR